MRATARIKVSPAWRAPTWVGSYAPTWVGSYMAGSHMGGFLHGGLPHGWVPTWRG